MPTPRSHVILVVEDDVALVKVYQKALEHEGFRVLTSHSAEDALEIAKSHGPVDLLVTDLVLESMGGRELVWRLREQYPNLPVILASGFTTESGALQLMDDSSIEFLPKPIDPGELVQKVQEKLTPGDEGTLPHSNHAGPTHGDS